MSLTLDDKQLLRSLSIIMVRDPKFARQLFIKYQGRGQGESNVPSPINKIYSVVELVIKHDSFDSDVDYLNALRDEINKLKDKDVKEILSSSL
ncbi:hypothetical protein ACEUA0_18650 [Aeromonas veronii]|uniref:hypothetical protein n=1 Tax=Aeromonas veronii TaxID=654 RepID=UPI002443C9FB|nr:hypothetical protein [Aeromonas veronii]